MNSRGSYDITLEVFGDALELRGFDSRGHSKRVTAYTIALARFMGLSSSQIRVIARASFMHDIGTMATPERILHKRDRLTSEEQAQLREHCRTGYKMLCKIPHLVEAAEIVYAHQEQFDGLGYPRGLSGVEIPLGARIFAVADTLDAITSDRPYRKAHSFDWARVEINRCCGTQFDPGVVEAYSSLPNELWRDLRDEIAKRY